MRFFVQRPLFRLGLAVSLAGMVGGCESLTGISPQPAASTAPQAPLPAPPPPRAAHAVPPPPPPAPAPLVEVKVAGLSEDGVQELLGPPAETLDRPPARVWEYRSGNCAVDIYFYLDVGRNAFYALHYDSPAPTSSGSPAAATVSPHDAADRCLQRVYNARRDR